MGTGTASRGALLLVLGALLSSLPAHAEILVATAGPFTGINLFRGEQIQHGAELAVEDINRAGGVLGQTLRLAIADDACDPAQAVAVANKLVNDGVAFVAGHVCSHSSIPASRVYEQHGVIMISPASTNPKLTDEGGDNVFRVCGRDDQQGVVAGDYLADAWAERNIAILHDGSTYGEGLAAETRKQLTRRGVEAALYAAIEPGRRNYADVIDRLQAARIDVVYVGGYTAETGLLVRQSRDRGYSAQFVTGDAVTNDEFWLITGAAGEGTRGTFDPDPRERLAAADAVARLRARGFEPSGYTLHTYAALQAWAQAVTLAGTLDSNSVIAALRRGSFNTVLGRIDFDDKGDIDAPAYVWYQWRSGQYVPLEENAGDDQPL